MHPHRPVRRNRSALRGGAGCGLCGLLVRLIVVRTAGGVLLLCAARLALPPLLVDEGGHVRRRLRRRGQVGAKYGGIGDLAGELSERHQRRLRGLALRHLLALRLLALRAPLRLTRRVALRLALGLPSLALLLRAAAALRPARLGLLLVVISTTKARLKRIQGTETETWQYGAPLPPRRASGRRGACAACVTTPSRGSATQ